MKQIAGYVSAYFRSVDPIRFVVITLALSVLISFNYAYGLNALLLSHPDFSGRFIGFYILYFSVFGATWLTGLMSGLPRSSKFYLLVALSPAVFALKVCLQVNQFTSLDDNFLNVTLQWPLKAFTTLVAVTALWYMNALRPPIAGLSARGFHARPYLIILLLMVPAVMIAGHSADFQNVYPKLQLIPERLSLLQKFVFELCYGLDFFTIELFFRGFLILAFIKYAGKKAILPMAVFYCTIHFGKPVAECISSYLGGLILGAVVYNTKSIWGGLIIHLGIAWMMEIAGALY